MNASPSNRSEPLQFEQHVDSHDVPSGRDSRFERKAGRQLSSIAIVGINYAPELTGIAVYTTGMAEYFAAREYDVRVYTGFAYYPKWEKSDADRLKLWEKSAIRGAEIRRHWQYVPKRPSALKRILHEATFTLSASLGYLFGPRADVTVIVSPPLTLGLPVAFLAWLKGSRTVFHVQDLQPDAAIELGMLKKGFLAKLMYAVERAIMNRVDRVSTISRGMQEKIASKGVKPDKLLLFPNWADSTLVRPMHRDTAYRREWGLGERHVVLYSGNLGVKQGLHSLIDAANELRHESDIVFVIVGDGAERPALEQHAASLGIANVQFRPLQPPERLGELLATADVAVIPQRRSVTDIVLPSKLSNILAAARPVVAAATAESHFGRIIEESGSGVLVEPENPSAIALAILGLFEDPELRLDMGAAGRKWMLDHLGPDVVLAKFSADLERLVAGA